MFIASPRMIVPAPEPRWSGPAPRVATERLSHHLITFSRRFDLFSTAWFTTAAGRPSRPHPPSRHDRTSRCRYPQEDLRRPIVPAAAPSSAEIAEKKAVRTYAGARSEFD